MTDISGINGVSDDSIRHYTPTTEEVRDSYASWSDAYPEFDRWLFHIQEDAWEAGYQAGVHDGRYDTVRETSNPHTDWSA